DLAAPTRMDVDPLQSCAVPQPFARAGRDNRRDCSVTAPDGFPDIRLKSAYLAHGIAGKFVDPSAAPAKAFIARLNRWGPRGQHARRRLARDGTLTTGNIRSMSRHAEQDAQPIRRPVQVFYPPFNRGRCASSAP